MRHRDGSPVPLSLTSWHRIIEIWVLSVVIRVRSSSSVSATRGWRCWLGRTYLSKSSALTPLAVLHLAQLPEGMINLGKCLLLGRGSRAHHVDLAVRPAHLCNHLLEEADLVIGDVDCNCRHNVIEFINTPQRYKVFPNKNTDNPFFY